MKPKSSSKKKAAQEPQKKTDLITNAYQSAFIQGFVVLSISIGLYVLIASIIAGIYHPDLLKALQLAKEILVDSGSAAPKPFEKLLSLTAMLFFPISAIALFCLGRRYAEKIPPGSLQILYWCSVAVGLTAVLFVACKGFAAPNPFANNPLNIHDNVAKTNFDFYFISTFMYDNYLLYCGILFPAILLYLLYRDKLPGRLVPAIKKAETVFVYAFCAAIAVVVFFISAFKFPYTFENKYDFNAVFYSVVQVYNGIPMLVDHFTNTYGQYPHFVVPVMKLFGLSVLSFSGIMAFLVSLCFIFLFLSLRKIIGSQLLILFGITSVFYNCYMYFHLITPFDSSFAMAPIRWVFPFGLILYAVYYLQKRDKKAYFASFFIFALGILWNPDFGMVSFLSLIAFYCYLEFEQKKFARIVKKISLHLLVAGISLAAAFSAYALYIKIAFGSFPDLGGIFSTIKVFSIVGAGMLPIPLPFHPWMLVALVYLIGIAVSVYHMVNKSVSPRSAVIFLLTAIGVTAFQYYQGRSHDWNLFLSNPWCFILLTIFADDLLSAAKKHRGFIVPLAAAVFALSFSFFQTLYSCGGIADLLSEDKNREKNAQQQSVIMKNADAIHSLAGEKEKVLILSADYYQGLYYCLSHTAAAINPGLEDLFFKADYERILSFIADNEKSKVFFDPGSFRYSNAKIPLLLSSLYDVRNAPEEKSSIMFLTKKKPSMTAGAILPPGKNPVLHERFDTDIKKKMLFEEGKDGPIALGNQFSIQVLFKPARVAASPYTAWQTVFGNVQGSAGVMLMQNNTNPADYFFAVCGRQFDCPVDAGTWNFLALDVNNGVLRAFKNGRLIGTIDTHATFRNSETPLYVGSYTMQGGFFWGDIKELEIANCLLEEKDLAATWEKAQKALK